MLTSNANPNPIEPLNLEELACWADEATRERHARIRDAQAEIDRLAAIDPPFWTLAHNPERIRIPRSLFRLLKAESELNGAVAAPADSTQGFAGTPFDIIEGC